MLNDRNNNIFFLSFFLDNKKTRTVKKEVPQDSFFRFFSPPTEDQEGYDEMIEQDFELGEILKTKVIPHAVDWFTGEALEYEDFMGEGDEDEVRSFLFFVF